MLFYGPYQCVGSVGTGHHLDQFAHGSFFGFKGQFYHIWTYYIRPGYKYRECIITYCHIDDRGNIVTDTGFLDKHLANGMGQYQASWPKIEAEWYYEKSESILKKNCEEGGFELTGIENGSWVKFVNMDFGTETGQFSARISNIKCDGNIEIRLDSITGKLLGQAFVSVSGNQNKYNIVSCLLEKVSGKRDLFLKFNGDETTLFNLDYYVLIEVKGDR